MNPLIPQTATVISAAFSACAFTGCASHAEIKGTEPPYFMHREMVIQAVQQCEEAEMRPRVVYGYQTIQDRRVPVPIDVQCEPSAWRKSR